MATTEIHAITVTPNRAVGYALADKFVAYNSDDEINKEVAYRLVEQNGEKYICYNTLNSFQNCNMLDPYSTFKDMQEKWQNTKYKNEGKKQKENKNLLYGIYTKVFTEWKFHPKLQMKLGANLRQKFSKVFPL